MKLRDKKTGKVEEAYITMDGDKIAVIVADMPLCGNSVLGGYDSLAELNEEWEDYEPTEPRIKDERIRKIIRAWADENDSTRAVYYSPKNELADSYGNIISFNLIFGELKHGAEYTIAELCGEEEE